MSAANKWKRHLSADDRRAKAIIEACVESGAGIEYLDGAPRFRYFPLTAEQTKITSFKGREHGGPSGRGSVTCGRGNVLKLKNWTPSRLDANPMYGIPMAGDPSDLTIARKAWAEGIPDPLRIYLAKQASARTVAPAANTQGSMIYDL